ncbi:hypothetical protein [Paraburkholderia solisilvae]|uniref:Uncharacterized protein n=1 Tax=Paraburkholderia solisilvae TaxID=624376 RepID=A0A6J5EQQ2_9BURK|nr:hypothetical protein [Paraburkholderia solisilvae]CAB3768214.1 hypothetical protein LMG29739_05258 [Paraburkholderia solisilvae]
MRTYNTVLGGLMQAVSGDFVACGCEEQPRIIARYATLWTFIDEGSAQLDGKPGQTEPVDQAASGNYLSDDVPRYDEQVLATGRGATDGYPYFIEMSDGRTEGGRLERPVLLSRISTMVADDYTIYWGDEALAKQAGA